MNKIHEKSPCCRGNIWRLGERRRKCSLCKKTWRAWSKKRGPKRHRTSPDLLLKYLSKENGPIRKQAQKRDLSSQTLQARMAQELQFFNQTTSWPEIPAGNLIAVADAMIHYIDGVIHTFHFVLLRPINSNQAVILPFFINVDQGEGYFGWSSAFALVPAHVQSRIKVLVCDGAHALISISREKGWILQRCHFHILARLRHCGSTGRFGKNTKRSIKIQKIANIILHTKDEEALKKALNELIEIRQTLASRTFRSVISGFVKHHRDFRSFLEYPHYQIPNTSNSAEHLIGRIRDLQYRAHGFRTLTSLSSWIEALLKFTKKITCNPKINTPN